MSQKLTEGFDLCTENNKIEIIENDTEVYKISLVEVKKKFEIIENGKEFIY